MVDSGLPRILAGIVLIIIGFVVIKDSFWRLVFVAAGFIIITIGGGSLRRARRQFNQQNPANSTKPTTR